MAYLVGNIGSLIINDSMWGVVHQKKKHAFAVEGDKIIWVGEESKAPACDARLDVEGGCVIPGFVDSHAHPVFAGSRELEFAARMAGETYQAGGINSTVTATRAASKNELRANLQRLQSELFAGGITHFEAKSGYGLDVETERISLEVAREFTEDTTFLGAHLVPLGANPDSYVDLVTGEMLEAAAPLAKWIDVFCDEGAFDLEQSRRVLLAGIARGLKPRIHANQIRNIGAIDLAIELDCASADHCTHLSDHDVDLLAGGNTVATFLPGAEFSTRSAYPNAGRLLNAGARIAIATDCNPGSSFTTSMGFCIAVAVREMGLSVDQAFYAATIGGANALRDDTLGNITEGNRADFAVLDAPNHFYFAYRPGVQLVTQTFVAGKKVFERK
ncbi:imidazolonepropionase [Candidatus Aquiluna sp. UB-MaderosW2red]|uniref:imidazolonepropionase n=1 Tax=Candidatus Aquiluna sp. UB-MaderosW2red TaxID=1855377 RepID=UPI000875D8E4|nr:imidazolonepropionase [Candidatus Aquiluna sp. UB-MaderosW2red]